MGWWRLPWLVGASFNLVLASFHLDTLHVRCPLTPCPTNNQPPIHPIISVNKMRMRTFYVEQSSAHAWLADACAVWPHNFIILGWATLGEAAEMMEKLANKSIDWL